MFGKNSRQKKKRDEEAYKAAKLRREKEELVAYYKGTPLSNFDATSQEILAFLYEIWEPQLTKSYRKNANITTSCRQDQRLSKRIAQTLPKKQARLHRARLVIHTAVNMSTSALGGRPESARSATSISRPPSAKSVT